MFESFANALLDILYTCALTTIVASIVLGASLIIKAKLSN